MANLWGLSPSEWTALGTVVLSVATLIYIGVTFYLAIQARRSARSAEASAKAAQDAAQATSRAARVAEAALDRTFAVTYTGISGADSILHVQGARSVLYVHGLVLKAGYFWENGSDSPTGFTEQRVARVKELPSRRLPIPLHPGEVIPFDWPFGVIDLEKPVILYGAVRYSIEPDGVIQEVTLKVDSET